MAASMRVGCSATVLESWCGTRNPADGRSMDSADSDEQVRWRRLMAAAQDGDAASYRQLLGEVAPVVRRIVARRWRGTAEDAEDITQDVLLSLHAVRHTYDPARPFMPWLMAILRHRVADGTRRSLRRSHEFAVDDLEETYGTVAANDSVEALADRDALRKAVSGLPPGQRRAVEMLKLQEMSLKDASAASGMSIPALKVAVHRAVKNLRAVLRKDES